jgi:hypothetical protein
MFKKIIYIMFIFCLITSCANTYDSVKRGITGSKANSTDEFLVRKKDPLILPPDYENLPEPSKTIDSVIADEQMESFEKVFEDSISSDDSSISSSSSSTESSILKRIQSK